MDNDATRLKDLVDIGRLVEGCKAALFDASGGQKIVTTLDLGVGGTLVMTAPRQQ